MAVSKSRLASARLLPTLPALASAAGQLGSDLHLEGPATVQVSLRTEVLTLFPELRAIWLPEFGNDDIVFCNYLRYDGPPLNRTAQCPREL